MSGFNDCDIDPGALAAARHGERAGYEAVYRAYSGAVYTLAQRMLQHREAAEEVLQDTFVEVLRHIGAYRGEAPLGAWIRRIAVNKVLAQRRSAWHRYARPLEGLAEPAAPVTGSADGLDGELAAALAQLKPEARTVVWLYDVEGYSHREIAEMMGKTVSYSKSQLSRAHARLRVLSAPLQDELSCMQALNNC